jgi:hypothetical protein
VKIQLKKITVEELYQGYEEIHAHGGVVGYSKKLDVRPPYQREFVYKDKQRNAVIDTVRRNFPLNVMYWAVRNDGGYEVIDGQQRTIALCRYVNGDFSIDDVYFHNLQDDQRRQILDYECMIYFCSGTDSEKLDWFKTINIAGEKLTEQELRNAVYHGPWTADAKRYFSKHGCPAYQIAGNYLMGNAIRQDYLETAIDWLSEGNIEAYMAKHQGDSDAQPLWNYFESVISWAKAAFPDYRREMKSVPWGRLYNDFKDQRLDAKKLAKAVAKLMEDDEVGNKAGIYTYLLNSDERWLNLRAFADKEKREAYERQKGKCVKCGKHFDISEMEADHVKPWHKGGKTVAANCQMLCKDDNRRKAGK